MPAGTKKALLSKAFFTICSGRKQSEQLQIATASAKVFDLCR